MSSVEVKSVAEPYLRLRAIAHLDAGKIVIFAGGTGNPYFTTDTAAALRATEIEAEAIFMAKNGVDGVYDDDPRTNKKAKMFKEITCSEIIKRDLKVMDLSAVEMLKNKDIDVRVFNMAKSENFVKVTKGEDVGTVIKKG